jgi:hypothetical protein
MAVLLSLSFLASAGAAAWAADRVTVLKTPNSGIQPQALVDAKGTLHLLYFKGDPAAGDLFYVHRGAGKERFSMPMRVNSQAGSAVAIGSIRGGQIALGKGGRIHVAWNGSSKARSEQDFPMLYARMNAAGTAFEEQRNLMRASAILDGGGTVAADQAGNVYIAWHGLVKGGERGEGNRRVWVASSADAGRTIERERPAWTRATGVCACCSMKAFADRRGNLYVFYRSAGAGVNRDMYLLVSTDRGKSFQGSLVHRWKVPG